MSILYHITILLSIFTIAWIVKDNIELRNIADDYIRHDLIDDFNELVNYQINNIRAVFNNSIIKNAV